MARNCCVISCGNGDYKLERWKKLHSCEIPCACDPPFQLYNFPTLKKNPDDRLKWIKLINRSEGSSSHKLWEPKKNSRVCSRHFKDGMPTKENPYPTEELGYSTDQISISTTTGAAKRRTSIRKSSIQRKKSKKNCIEENIQIDADDADETETNVEFDKTCEKTFITDELTLSLFTNLLLMIMLALQMVSGVFFVHALYQNANEKRRQKHLNIVLKNVMEENRKLKRKVLKLENAIKECKCKLSINRRILKNDEECKFYTGINTIALFDKIHKFVQPLVQRKWYGRTVCPLIKRTFKNTPKKFGAKTKLSSREEFFLCLMKIRLGLLQRDLANRFGISTSLASRIFTTWSKAIASVLKSFIWTPPMSSIANSRPVKFKDFPKLHSIADATEIFLQTPKSHAAQRITWSNYKHHNTAKVLVAVTPNGMISFLSSTYSGSVSDKELTIQSGYLDQIEPHQEILVDKGFNIIDECASRYISVLVPPGKCGHSQMLPQDLKKTQKLLNSEFSWNKLLGA